MISIIARFLTGQRTYTTEDLISAIRRKRDIAEIRQIISGVEDINQPDNDGKTALFVAVFIDSIEMVRELIACGVNVNHVNERGRTALFGAVRSNKIEMLRELLAKGADVKHADNGGKTALFVAVFSDSIEMVRELLAKGADLKHADNDGKTALCWAVLLHNQVMVRELVTHGADETSLTKAQQTRFTEAIALGKACLIKNTRSSACALADTGRELQIESLMQNHPCREASEVQEHENNIAAFPESILAKIASYAAEIQRPNSLTPDQIIKCAEVGTKSLEATDREQFDKTNKDLSKENQ